MTSFVDLNIILRFYGVVADRRFTSLSIPFHTYVMANY